MDLRSRRISVDAFFESLGRFVVGFRWPVVGLWVTGSTVTSVGVILGGTLAVFAIVGVGGSSGSQLRASREPAAATAGGGPIR